MPSAGIVYEGALANQTPDGNNNQNHSERTLFKGLKFWISSKVPNRQAVVESVKANGGRKVELEKNADILIADHALKRDFPAGSLSWKYITDSIREGQLADRDLYTIDHVTAKGARPGGSSTSNKTTRTPYTPEDDSILIHWVLQKERSGAPIRGNQIYMDLAQKYPRHTWQSWRDRFSKRYDQQHRHDLAALLPQNYQPPPPPPPPPPSGVVPTPVRKKENVRPGTPPATSTTVHTPAPGRSQAVSIPATGRVTFTQEDDQDLVRYLKQMKRQGESLQGNLIYQVFAEQHPRHSWQSWRNRWVKTLQATTNMDDPTEPSLPKPTPRATIHPQAKATPQSADQAAAKRRLSTALHRARQHVPTKSWSSPMGPVKATITSSAHKQSPPRSTPLRLEEINKRARLIHDEKKKIKSASIIQRAWRSYQARKQDPERQSLIMFQALAQGALVRWACAPAFESQSPQYSESEDEGSVDLGQPLEERVSGPTQTPREQFYVFFNQYNEVMEANSVPWVTIGGKAVDMWDLWTAVTEQDVPANARDWQEIAELLDFDWIAEPDVPNQLQAAFQEHLAEFENYYKEFQEAQPYELNQETDEDSGEEEEEEESDEADNDQIEAEGEEEGNATQAEDTTLRQDPNTTEFRSSPPIIGTLKSSGGLKRGLDQMMSSPLVRRTRKRPRYDVDDEVPESPSKRWQSPLPPIAEVTSLPELITDVAMINNDDDDDAADDVPILGDDGDDYGVEEHREEDEDPFITQPQQPWQPTVEEALSLRLSSASRSQELSSAQKKSATQPSPKTQAQYISSDSDSDSSSDAFGPPINSPRPPPEQRRSPIPSIEAPEACRPLSPRDTAPASRSPPPRFRIPPDPFASDDEGSSNLRLAPPRQTQRQAQAQPSAHPPSRPSASRSSLPASAGRQERHQLQHAQSTAPPKPLPHTGRDLGNGIASEDPVAILNRYLAKGYKRRHCIRGVRATTHDPNVAETAIDALESGGGLPDNVPGIWTEMDDKELWMIERWEERMRRGEDRNEERERRVREVERRLLEKHGRKRMKLRMDFLKKML